ncbi:RCC1/BLIP-II [Coprinopsis marcescibilis]|uniref:RCC1/BLIP-II n=1 Tax=Coprinopsis marcescibilis TaxID=230819 RepID=A0A5C3LAL5_COPMA|nr:RCC1/BLIP-II [Coprinopsis marcescibilis]
MPLLSELPVEVLLDNIFPFLSARDLTQLTRTSKLFAILCTDDAVWKRKLACDFNFTGEGTARTSGWKTIYRGIWRPKVFVWGEKANGRLGVTKYPKSSVGGVPFPFEVKFHNARIVSIVAGGMSFHALDSDGNVHVWGTLNVNSQSPSLAGFSDARNTAHTPLKLQLPSLVRSISCGRLHSSVLDKHNRVWTFVNWGRPFSFTTHALNNPLSAPVQVECGWSHSALLTATGEVFVWWPLEGTLAQSISEKEAELNSQEGTDAQATNDKTIPCTTWSTDIEPIQLPGLPPLPELRATGKERRDELPRLIQIAGYDRQIVGLTNEGHVLKFGSLDDEGSVSRGRWEYLPRFSDLNAIRKNRAFTGEADGGGKLEAPSTLQITHVSANFQTFVAYSTGAKSTVLIGNTDTDPDSDPQIKPELQNRSVISVVVGDYHNAALTSDGKLLTWGQFSSGALGLGDPAKLERGQPGGYSTGPGVRNSPPAVDTPTEVKFDYGCKSPRNRFCFAVTASGWHTGALVMDLEDGEQEDVYEMENPDPEVPHYFDPRQYETPPIAPTGGIFRIGHAGRGRGFFGRGSGRGNHGSGPVL